MTQEFSETSSQTRWFQRVLSKVSAREGTELQQLETGHIAIRIRFNGHESNIELFGPNASYAEQKEEFSNLRKLLTELGIQEGESYSAPAPPRRGMTPMIQQARARQKREFEGWQDVWRQIRGAEKNLDVEFELKQMMDYY
ncbi:MAG: hypothetical protein VW226_00930 [Rhodospirillaceae bacterium]